MLARCIGCPALLADGSVTSCEDDVVGSKFGDLGALSNEATVEQFFVVRLMKDLGYKDVQIKPKATIDELKISKGENDNPIWPR
ncbi:hypothetical protein, partial [Dietzia sp. SLG310A2-38A2]|uniref:hypothetical protein n=1 Tax=Dietzia sp. SLG310A2-38A2 TaxID=1630643 RepID=UPI0019D510BD